MKVEVKGIPIRHNGQRYLKGEPFSIQNNEYERLKPHVNVLEQEEELNLDKPIEDMKLEELKSYAKLKEISLDGVGKTKGDILVAIQAAENQHIYGGGQ